MKIVIDMNLSPEWEDVFHLSPHAATHWSRVGALDAPDEEILSWARAHEHIVPTHDLDFGAILAATGADSPSVLQVRAQDVTPVHLGPLVLSVLRQFEDELRAGVLISIDEAGSRARILPIREQLFRRGVTLRKH